MITLSASQLNGSGHTLHVHPSTYDRIQKAKKANRGCRVCIAPGEMEHDIMHGGSLWSWLKDTLWPAVRPAVSGVLDAAVAPVASALGPLGSVAPIGRKMIKNLTGVGVSTQRKLIKGSPEAKAHMAALRANVAAEPF